MTDKEVRALKAKNRQEVATPVEQIKPASTFTPAVDIFEKETEVIFLADMPEVKAKNLILTFANLNTLDKVKMRPDAVAFTPF